MLIEIGQKAKETSYILGKMGTDLKNAGLLAAAQEILDEEDEILKANAADVAKAKERGMAPGLVDSRFINSLNLAKRNSISFIFLCNLMFNLSQNNAFC